MNRTILRLLVAIVLSVWFLAPIQVAADGPRRTIVGVAFSPAHIPFPSRADILAFFPEAAEIGSHVMWICEWQSMPRLADIGVIQGLAKRSGLKFHFYLSPISLAGGRKTPAIPASVKGSSFKDPAVRRAYKDEMLTLARLHPDYLGLATEVNFLAQNPDEFAAFVALARESYDAIKLNFPSQTVTISFQWDVMSKHKQFDILRKFEGSVDVYSFTSYPDAFGYPVKIADDYYLSIRDVLPKERIGFSELGWSSAPPSNDEEQAAFYGRLPQLMAGTRSEYATLALMHDVSVFTGDLSRLNAAGIRTIDDKPKKSWDAVLRLPEMP